DRAPVQKRAQTQARNTEPRPSGSGLCRSMQTLQVSEHVVQLSIGVLRKQLPMLRKGIAYRILDRIPRPRMPPPCLVSHLQIEFVEMLQLPLERFAGASLYRNCRSQNPP